MSALAALAAAWLLAAGAPLAGDADPELGPPADASGAVETTAPGDQDVDVAAAYAAAESLQGSLDGLWKVVDGEGRTLYIFSLSEAGDGPAPLAANPGHPGVEGAWRDPARAGQADGSGFLDSIDEDGGRLWIKFADRGGQRPEALTLKITAKDRWTGQLSGGGAARPVVMTRF
jgi:hypothetical protein